MINIFLQLLINILMRWYHNILPILIFLSKLVNMTKNIKISLLFNFWILYLFGKMRDKMIRTFRLNMARKKDIFSSDHMLWVLSRRLPKFLMFLSIVGWNINYLRLFLIFWTLKELSFVDLRENNHALIYLKVLQEKI